LRLNREGLVSSTTSGFLRLNRNPFIDGLLSSRQSHRVRTRRGAISTFKAKRRMSAGNYHRGQCSPTMAAFASSTATSRRRGEGRHAAGAPPTSRTDQPGHTVAAAHSDSGLRLRNLVRDPDGRTDCAETTGAEAPFRHLVLTTTAWPLRASRDTPALLARLV
jgi:hypothetical protein